MGPVKYEKIERHCEGEEAVQHPDWGNAANNAYKQKLTLLCEELQKVFPATFDISRVTACVQEKGETVEKYLHRLMEAFAIYGGMPRPADTTNMTPWEQQLSQHFLTGLSPPIAAATMQSCIGWKHARLTVLTDHANHAMERRAAQGERKEAAEQKATAAAQLTMMQAVARIRPEGRGRQQGGGGGECFTCGSNDHWAKDCPKKRPNQKRRGRGRGRGDRSYERREADHSQQQHVQAD